MPCCMHAETPKKRHLVIVKRTSTGWLGRAIIHCVFFINQSMGRVTVSPDSKIMHESSLNSATRSLPCESIWATREVVSCCFRCSIIIPCLLLPLYPVFLIPSLRRLSLSKAVPGAFAFDAWWVGWCAKDAGLSQAVPARFSRLV